MKTHPLFPNLGVLVKTYKHKGKTIEAYKNKAGTTYSVSGCLFHTLKAAKDFVK